MKGKDRFNPDEAGTIRDLLSEVRCADRRRQKELRRILRQTYRFYITDFDRSGLGFTASDFDALVANGRVTIRDHGT